MCAGVLFGKSVVVHNMLCDTATLVRLQVCQHLQIHEQEVKPQIGNAMWCNVLMCIIIIYFTVTLNPLLGYFHPQQAYLFLLPAVSVSFLGGFQYWIILNNFSVYCFIVSVGLYWIETASPFLIGKFTQPASMEEHIYTIWILTEHLHRWDP